MAGDENDERFFTLFESSEKEPHPAEPHPAPEPSVSSTLPGIPAGAEHFGHYALVQPLGRGAQGSVYLAVDTKLKRKVALKVLNVGEGLSPEARVRFRREAEAAARLEHPGICAVFEAGEIDATPFIAMKYVDGQPLSERLAAGARPPARADVLELVALVEKAARALDAAHERGIVHRDLKPQNVMIDAQGEPVLLDFGLARDLESKGQTVTTVGDLLGTPLYMSPEQLRGQTAQVGRRSDVYALGVILYECATGQRPFDAPTLERLYQQILAREPPDPRRLNAAVSEDLQVVILTALSKEKERRYASANALADDLRAVLENHPIAARPVSALGRVVRWARREPIKAALAAVLIVGVPSLALLGGFLWASRTDIQLGRWTKLQAQVDELLDEGTLLIERGRFAEGRPPLEEALRLDPGCASAVAALWYTYPDPKGLEFVERHAERYPDDADYIALRSMALYRAGNVREAAELRKDHRYNRSALPHFAEGMTYFYDQQQGSRRAALAGLRAYNLAILKPNRASWLLHILRGQAADHARVADVTRETARILTDLWPDRPASWIIASEQMQRFDLDWSIRANAAGRARCEKGSYWDVAGRRSLAWLLAKKGRFEDALPVLEELHAKFPLTVAKATSTAQENAARLAWVHAGLGRRAEARALLDRIAASSPKRDALEICSGLLASFEVRDGNHVAAAERLRKAVAAAPKNETLRCRLGHVLWLDGKAADARTEAEAALALCPEVDYAHAVRGLALLARGDRVAAHRAWTQAHRLAPWCFENAALQRPERWQVLATLQLSAALFPGDAELHDRLARCLVHPLAFSLPLGAEAALAPAQRAVELTDGKHAAYLATLARAQHAGGDAAAAAATARRALALDAKLQEALRDITK